MDSVFETIDPPRRIVFRDLDEGRAPPLHRMQVTIDLGDEGPATRIVVSVRFASVAERDEAIAHGFTGPIVDSFERLEALAAR